MGNYNKVSKSLILTNEIFTILLNNIIERFSNTYQIQDNYKETEVFGFGNYTPEKPNLKNEFEKIAKAYINGKYLYNKKREALTGKPFIKISDEYRYVFFNYLGLRNLEEFLAQGSISEEQKKKQVEILINSTTTEDYYYTSYYYGEDNRLNKGEVIIRNKWKNIEINYVYEDNYGKIGTYTFFGTITKNEGFLFIDTKFFNGNKKNEGAKLVFFIGKSAPHERDYLIGTYSGFDKYDNTIAGKMILKKFDNKQKMEEEVQNKDFDPVICQELNKKRIVVDSVIRKNPLLFSKKSPYAQILNDISREYLLKINHQKETYDLKLKVEKYHLKIKSIDESLFIENDEINLINNGQVLNIVFTINGVFYIKRISIYIKVYNLIKENGKRIGKYTAADVNNNIINGEVEFLY
ncbi:hypothetical protein [Tenacibaculum xiamenense]|uniref:hypothetical protein n=1 Tax=Tenacibaculum xiamenense TaxID=1261553 RepID=UPI0038941391